ncbi:MAG: UDP-N-acetylglucosamine--LPS N-acetylglucosamine transferase [Pseudomonadota bacterium]
MRRVIAIASGGGHWVQLMRLRPAWDGQALTYVTTVAGYEAEVRRDALARGQAVPRFFTVTDANLKERKLHLLRQLLQVAWIVLTTRPHAVVSTGASLGYFALRLGRLIGARTIWIDSIANAEELSLSGRKIGRHADVWLTQWPELADEGRGLHYEGSVL